MLPPPPSDGWGVVFSNKRILVFGAGAGKEFLHSSKRVRESMKILKHFARDKLKLGN
jgi:hypothetical protein